MKKYRNEWKYRCHEKTLTSVMERLKGILPCDKNGIEGSYVVRSLYFDDPQSSFARDTESGISHRYKYRIRYYGDAINTLKLEKKEKLDGMCHKDSCRLSQDEFEMIMAGDYMDLFWETDNKVLKEFCITAQNRCLSPRVIVEYDRTAVVEPFSNVRITADRNISCSSEIESFLTGDYLKNPILPTNHHILEVKFDHVLPGYIKRITGDDALIQSSFSKYYLARKSMWNIGRRL